MRPISFLVSSALSAGRVVRASLSSAAGVRTSAFLNGAACGFGVGLAAVIGQRFFPADAVAIMLGALSVSISDTASSLPDKAQRMALAWALSGLAMLMAISALPFPLIEAAVVLVIGFGAAMVSSFGRSAVPIGVATVLPLVFARSLAIPQSSAFASAFWFALGGALYGVYAALVTPLLAFQTKRLLLREAIDLVSEFLRAQSAALGADGEAGAVYRRLVDSHAALAERIQAARDVVFVAVRGPRDRAYAAVLVGLVDLVEAAVSEQADLDALLELREGEVLRGLRALLRLAASELDAFSRSLFETRPSPARYEQERADLKARIEAGAQAAAAHIRQAVVVTGIKVDRLFARIDEIWDVSLNPGHAAAVIGGIDLESFVQRVSFHPRTLARHLTFRSPTLRYAIRLALALLCGYALGEALPSRAHSVWILLTIALVMRANHSITQQRRNERVLGNVIGAGVSALVIVALPNSLLPIIVFVTVGLTHAFAVQSYLVASIASCVTALTLIHAVEPNSVGFFLLMRVLDTAIGAAIAYVFSFVLPVWEYRMAAAQLPDFAQGALEYAVLALSDEPQDEAYRFARRRFYDAAGALAASSRRMTLEPAAGPLGPKQLARVLALSYSLGAELASIHLFLRSRNFLSDSELARALARARAMIKAALGSAPAAPYRAGGPRDEFADAGPLSRRLSRAVSFACELAGNISQVRTPEGNPAAPAAAPKGRD